MEKKTAQKLLQVYILKSLTKNGFEHFEKETNALVASLEERGYSVTFDFVQKTNIELPQPNVWMITDCKITGNNVLVEGQGFIHNEKGKFESLINALIELMEQDKAVENILMSMYPFLLVDGKEYAESE